MSQVHNTDAKQNDTFNRVFNETIKVSTQDGLFIADKHDDLNIREYLAATLKDYQTLGYNTLYYEGLLQKDQPLIDAYLSDAPGARELIRHGLSNDYEAHAPGQRAATIQVLDICKKLGIRVVGINRSELTQIPIETDQTLTERYMTECDAFWSQVIDEDAPKRQGGKYLLWAGAAHSAYADEDEHKDISLKLAALPMVRMISKTAQEFSAFKQEYQVASDKPVVTSTLAERAPHHVAYFVEASPNQRVTDEVPASVYRPFYEQPVFAQQEYGLAYQAFMFLQQHRVPITEEIGQKLEEIYQHFYTQRGFEAGASFATTRRLYEQLAGLLPVNIRYDFSETISQSVLHHPSYEQYTALQAAKGKLSILDSVGLVQDSILTGLTAQPSHFDALNHKGYASNLKRFVDILPLLDKAGAMTLPAKEQEQFSLEKLKSLVITAMVIEQGNAAALGEIGIDAKELQEISDFMGEKGIKYKGVSKTDSGETLNFSYNNTPYSVPIKTRGL